MNYVYIVECVDGTLYTGWTVDIAKRLACHNDGTGAKYTRGRGPVTLVYCEEHQTMQAALKREREIKRYPKKRKLLLCEGFRQFPDFLSQLTE